MIRFSLISLSLTNIPWKTIGAFAILGILYIVAFSKDVGLLNREEKKHLIKLKKQTGNKIPGRYVNAAIGIAFVFISLLLSYLFYKR